MSTNPIKTGKPDRLEALLPWYAAGTLSRAEADEIDAALDADPLLRAHLARVEEERDETIAGNQALSKPSSRIASRLFAEIAAAAQPTPAPLAQRLLDGFGQALGGLAPRTLAMSAIGVAVAIFVLGAALGDLAHEKPESVYHTASGVEISLTDGAFALIGFAPAARADRIAAVLLVNGATIVEGPRTGGIYRIRIGASDMSPEARADAMTKLAADKTTVTFVIATQ